METGRYEIEGTDIFALVQEVDTDHVENRRPETHEEYVDIQYLVSGGERIGHAFLNSATQVKEDKRPEKDVIFYENPAGERLITLFPGDYAIFFPTDIHRPGCEYQELMKIKKSCRQDSLQHSLVKSIESPLFMFRIEDFLKFIYSLLVLVTNSLDYSREARTSITFQDEKVNF